MSKNLLFFPSGWQDYTYWQSQDKKTLKKINDLLEEIVRTPFDGRGKPEPLKGDMAGLWSRRIDQTNRIVYRVDGEKIEIVECRSHYKK